jgi:hypothetical protein
MATNKPAPDNNKAPAVASTRSFLRDDFPTIRRASLIFLSTVVLGAGLVFATQFLLDQQDAAVSNAQIQQNKTREMYLQAENELSEIHEFQPKYKQLVAQGFVGPERRLDWIESIRAVQKKATLEPINYEIAAQTVYQVDPQIDTGTLELRGSQMHLKMELIHEMDLINLLDGIKRNQIVDLQSCVIKRLPVQEDAELPTLLEGECNLVWLTMGKRGGDNDGSAAPTIVAGQ